MGYHMTSFTADAMRGFVGELAADLQARTDMVEQNRHNVGAMLKQSAKDRQTAETLRNRQARRTNEARRRFVNRLKSGVTSMVGGFHNMRVEMASEIQAAANVFRYRNLRDGNAAAFSMPHEPRANQGFVKSKKNRS